MQVNGFLSYQSESLPIWRRWCRSLFSPRNLPFPRGDKLRHRLGDSLLSDSFFMGRICCAGQPTKAHAPWSLFVGALPWRNHSKPWLSCARITLRMRRCAREVPQFTSCVIGLETRSFPIPFSWGVSAAPGSRPRRTPLGPFSLARSLGEIIASLGFPAQESRCGCADVHGRCRSSPAASSSGWSCHPAGNSQSRCPAIRPSHTRPDG